MAGAFSVLVGLNVMAFGVPINIPMRTPASELSVPGWDTGLQLAGGSCSPPAPPSAGRGRLGSAWAPSVGARQQHNPAVLQRREGAVPAGQAPSFPTTAGVI